MKKLALLAVFLALPLFAADTPKPAPATPAPKAEAAIPVVPDAIKLKISMAERDIITIGRQMDKMVQDYQKLQQSDQKTQQTLQEGFQEAYDAVGDSKREKFDLDPDTLELTRKATPPQPAASHK